MKKIFVLLFFLTFLLSGCKISPTKEYEVNFIDETPIIELETKISNEKCVVNLEDCFVITGQGVVVTGRVESGIIRVGDKVIIKQQDNEIETEVNGLEMFRKTLDEAKEGDNIGIIISYPDRLTISSGDTLIVLENN